METNQETVSDHYSEMHTLINTCTAAKSVLLAAVMAEIIGVAGKDACVAFLEGKGIPSDTQFTPWLYDAIPLIGLPVGRTH
jgi:hypothetical protein